MYTFYESFHYRNNTALGKTLICITNKVDIVIVNSKKFYIRTRVRYLKVRYRNAVRFGSPELDYKFVRNMAVNITIGECPYEVL